MENSSREKSLHLFVTISIPPQKHSPFPFFEANCLVRKRSTSTSPYQHSNRKSISNRPPKPYLPNLKAPTILLHSKRFVPKSPPYHIPQPQPNNQKILQFAPGSHSLVINSQSTRLSTNSLTRKCLDHSSRFSIF